jgi:type IV secretory pathway VirJ component
MRRFLAVALALTAAVAAAEASTKSTMSPKAGGGGPRVEEPAKPGSKQAQANLAEGFVEESITLPLFGRTTAYRPEPIQRLRGVVLFVSGDGGWNKGVVDMARRSAPHALVVGLSMPLWQKAVEKDPNRCWYPAGELESIAQALEKTYRIPRYLRPVLVGYSSGATVVYGALAQAPPDTFAGAVSLGFCNDIEVARPLCPQAEWKPSYNEKKRMSLLPVKPDLSARPGPAPRWIALQGLVDQVCDPNSVGAFASQIPAAKIVDLPKVGHGFSVPRHWGASYDASVEELLETVSPWEPLPEASRHVVINRSPAEIQQRLDSLDLPLELQWPTEGEPPKEALIFVSGDGGWADIDQHVATRLAAQGVGVVGWNALRYFWSAKTPETFRSDLSRVIEALPAGIPVFAGGYSFGAEIMPGTLSQRPPGAAGPLSRVAGLVLLGAGPYASYEVSPLDWVRGSEPPTQHKVREAIESLRGIPILCITGSDQHESGCPDRAIPGVENLEVPGGHHFGGDYDLLSAKILAFLRAGAGAPSPERSAAPLQGGR